MEFGHSEGWLGKRRGWKGLSLFTSEESNNRYLYPFKKVHCLSTLCADCNCIEFVLIFITSIECIFFFFFILCTAYFACIFINTIRIIISYLCVQSSVHDSVCQVLRQRTRSTGILSCPCGDHPWPHRLLQLNPAEMVAGWTNWFSMVL